MSARPEAWRTSWLRHNFLIGGANARYNQTREKKKMLTYEQRRDMIVLHAWESWTKNGLRLDLDASIETVKTVQDAVTNTYLDDISDTDWLAATIKRLER